MNFDFKPTYGFSDLVDIMSLLRAPGGCPWDAEQTHRSIRRNFIEETYEVIEAIDTDDSELLCEELGDVLLQVVFHAQIEHDAGSFGMDEVCDGICKKLIVRHPHVFGDVSAEDSETVLRNWDAIKMQTKSQHSQTEVLDSVSKSLPSLIRAEKVQHKAAKSGMDFDGASAALESLKAETAELETALASGNPDSISDELGDVLFSAVNVSRFVGADAEKALGDCCERFIARFGRVEKLLSEQGLAMDSLSSEALDEYWQQAKTDLSSGD